MQACFRFYDRLNDFLPAVCRQRALVYRFASSASVKDAIASWWRSRPPRIGRS